MKFKTGVMCMQLLLIIFSVVVRISTGYAMAGSSIDLDESEKAWLDTHPVIRIAPDPDFAPFE